MSEKGIDYALNASLGNTERLLVFYDFSGMSGRHIGIGSDTLYYPTIENCDPAPNTGSYSGIITESGCTTTFTAKLFATGDFLINNKADLGKSNLKVNTPDLNYSETSTLFDFQFNADVTDCVLFGSLEKSSTTINDEVITGAKGYNVGITDRGHLFYQGFNNAKGDFIHTASSIELAKRNIIGFSVGSNSLNISRFDYLNNKIQTESFSLKTDSIANNDEFYLGGAQQYFRGGPAGVSGEYKTSDISLNSFCLLSGYLPPSAMFSIGSGFVGNYFTDAGTNTFKREITGYDQTIVQKTGITGYDYENTGSINIATGQYMMTGNFIGIGTTNAEEGDRYFVYRSFDDALSASGVKSFVKEEVGYLHPDSGYQYLPTGDRSAFDTLGLQNVEGAVNRYVEQQGISGASTIEVKLFGSRFMTGILSGISGVVQIPLYQTVIDRPAVPSSGVRLNSPSELLKKNFIYYLGKRI